MKKEFRIKDTREFGSILSRKRFYTCPSFTIYVKERAKDHARIGISVGKKLGNAVMRNKVKRQIRSMVREIYIWREFRYNYSSSCKISWRKLWKQ